MAHWTLIDALATLLSAGLVVLLVPTLVLLVQVLAARSARPTQDQTEPSAARPRLVVLMPAHNESAGIAAAIASVLPQLHAQDRLLVVADNCTDDTAAVATAAGANVVERHDVQRRGKGYALDFGVRHLKADPPEVVVIVDADCLLGPDCLTRLTRTCTRTGSPAQALYLMNSPLGAGLKVRLAELAWLVKNHVRPLGYWRLGLPCQLMGTGMAFPWSLICDAPLASGHIVEDMQLGLDLASQGWPPEFCPQALVVSSFPADVAGQTTQRTRWEHGHLGVIASEAPRLMWRALSLGQLRLLAMVLDLCLPPLASLALLLAAGASLSLVVWGASGSAWPMLIAAAALSLLAASILLAWQRFGRDVVSLKELLAVPAYVLAKLPIYARLLSRRQAEWVRTKRDIGHD